MFKLNHALLSLLGGLVGALFLGGLVFLIILHFVSQNSPINNLVSQFQERGVSVLLPHSPIRWTNLITKPDPIDLQTSVPDLPTSTNQQDRTATVVNDQDLTFDIERLYLLINAYRQQHEQSPLTTDSRLERSAQLKIEEMIEDGYFGHQDDRETESWHLFRLAGYHFRFAGENLSFGYNSPWTVFDAWTQSPEHNDQMLQTDYRDMGLAVDCQDFDQCLVVLHLGRD